MIRRLRKPPKPKCRLSAVEAASLGIAYLAGDPIPSLLNRFGLKSVQALRAHIGKLARKQWQAHRRLALRSRFEPVDLDTPKRA